jgi:hypothetical protein
MQRNHEKGPEKAFSRFAASLLGVILIGVTLAIAGSAVNWSAASEAQLVFAGGVPQPPLFEVKTEGGKHFFYVTSRPLLKNTGSRSGAVERVNVVPVGLKDPPRELKVLRLDKSEIAARETKKVRCEFVAVFDSTALDPQSRLEFRVHFYGPGDREIYWEGISIENIAERSSLHRRRSGESTTGQHSEALRTSGTPVTIMGQVQVI